MCCGTEAGSYLRLIDSCITQLEAQGPARTCDESKEEEEGWWQAGAAQRGVKGVPLPRASCPVVGPRNLGTRLTMEPLSESRLRTMGRGS